MKPLTEYIVGIAVMCLVPIVLTGMVVVFHATSIPALLVVGLLIGATGIGLLFHTYRRIKVSSGRK